MGGKLYVFRHAQSEDNESFTFSGRRDVSLTIKGMQEATYLRDQLKNVDISRAYCSDLTRSILTMEIVLQNHLNTYMCVDRRLGERSYGILEGQNKKKWIKYAHSIFKIFHRSYYIAPPDGESFYMVRKRVREFILELMEHHKNKDMNVAICVHSGSIRAFREYFGGVSEKDFNTTETKVAELFIYELNNG